MLQLKNFERYMMKKILITLALALAATSAFAADTLKTEGLTDKQKAEVALHIENLKNSETSPANVSETVRKEASAWGELGSNMGKAMVGAAKELGVAADEFSQTNLGKITVGVVVYKLIGRDIVKFMVGMLTFIAGSLMVLYLIFTHAFASSVKYEFKPTLWGHNKRSVVEIKHSEEGMVTRAVCVAVTVGLTLIVSLNCFF